VVLQDQRYSAATRRQEMWKPRVPSCYLRERERRLGRSGAPGSGARTAATRSSPDEYSAGDPSPPRSIEPSPDRFHLLDLDPLGSTDLTTQVHQFRIREIRLAGLPACKRLLRSPSQHRSGRPHQRPQAVHPDAVRYPRSGPPANGSSAAPPAPGCVAPRGKGNLG
jgi:hypothetical protein